MQTQPKPCCPHEKAAAGRLGVWLETGTLLVLAAFLVFSFFAGRLRLFIAPAYLWLPPLAALALSAMGLARLNAHLRGRTSCECEREGGSAVSKSICAALLILPILFALGVNPRGFSAEGVRKRLVSAPPRDRPLEQAIDWVLGLNTPERKAAAASVSLPKNPTVLDLLNVSSQADPKALEGRFVTVIGQCTLPEGPASGRFGLYRLVVTCCIADATAVSVEVARKPTLKLRSGQWVRAGGILKFDGTTDPSLPVVHAATVSPIAEPREPYL